MHYLKTVINIKVSYIRISRVNMWTIKRYKRRIHYIALWTIIEWLNRIYNRKSVKSLRFNIIIKIRFLINEIVARSL